MARLSVLCSGSSGNCTYVRYGSDTVLIDAGVSARRMTKMLCDNHVDISGIKGIFITHEHTDHIKGLRTFADTYGIHTYINAATADRLRESGQLPDERLVYGIENGETVKLGGLEIRSFPTSHDAAMSMGYRVTSDDGRSASYVTDLGIFSEDVLDSVKGSNMVVLESNHDMNMLRLGAYPRALKNRIAGEYGHLSNADAATAAVSLVASGTARIVLAHLSKDNNTPELAVGTVSAALSRAGMIEGRDYLLFAAGSDDGREYIF